MIGALLEAAPGGQVLTLAGQRLRHLLHAGVGVAVRRAAVNVVAVLRVRHDEHADVGDGAEVDELAQLVLDEARVDDCVDKPLGKPFF